MSSRRPLAKPAQGPAGAFGALLSAAVDQPDAVHGLALAYAALEPDDRRDLIPAVVSDALAEGICPSLVLAPLLGVETDRALAQQLADAIAETRGGSLSPHQSMRAMLAGDGQRGACVLVRPLHGTFAEVLALAWEQPRGITHSHVETLTTQDLADERSLRRLPTDLAFETTPVPFAIDLVTESLWNHRQLHGELPGGIARFADLFSGTPASVVDTGSR